MELIDPDPNDLSFGPIEGHIFAGAPGPVIVMDAVFCSDLYIYVYRLYIVGAISTLFKVMAIVSCFHDKRRQPAHEMGIRSWQVCQAEKERQAS
jgi:hypothetical protein